ncbi:MAG: hypothetical protein WD397_05460 [Wenzhouxiangellaceae bacterium]
MNRDDATRTHRAAVKLERLYHGYRATNRAIGMMIHRLEGSIATDEDMPDSEKRARLQQLTRRKALAQELDLAYAERIAQLEQRLAELRDWSE